MRKAVIYIFFSLLLYSEGFAQVELTANDFNNTWNSWTNVKLNDPGADPVVSYLTSSTYPTLASSAGGDSYFVKFNSYTSADLATLRLKSTSFSTTGYETITVNFSWAEDKNGTYTNTDEGVTIEWSTDGTNWNSSTQYPRYVASAASSTVGTWISKSCVLPVGAENQATLYIAFFFKSKYGYNCHMDNVTVTGVVSATAPTVTTAAITSIGATTATGGGEITDVGTAAVTVSGVCWDTSTDPTTSNSKSTTGPTSATTFSSEALSSLSAQTYYYVRAYATSPDGTGYGSNVNFWSLSTAPSGHSATFSAAVGGPSQINLSFTAASTYGADGYIILRKTGAVAPDATGVANAVAPGSQALTGGTTLVTTITSDATTTYSSTGLSANTQYYYCIIPFNYNGSNNETYNYYTAATIPTATATTVEGPSGEGLAVSGNLINNGTIVATNDVNYMTLNGSSKTISGAGVYTDVKLYIDGTIAFDGSFSSGKLAEAFINTSKTFTINGSKTMVNADAINYGTLVLSANSVWNNSGNWTNGGTVTHADNTSSVVFNGGSAQTILAGGQAFENITIANTSGGITLNDEVTVNTAATFSSGILTTTSANVLTFANSATVSGADGDSHVSGPVKKNTNSVDPFDFPIGDGTSYMPVGITPSAGDATVWTAQYFGNAHADTDLKSSNELTYLSTQEYWDLDKTGDANATITITWNASSGVTDVSKMLVAHYDAIAGEWESAGGTSITGNTSGGTVTSNGVWTSFSPFAPGFSASPLPVRWLNVEAECVTGSTLIKWSTASEINNDYFTIEKSLDGHNFTALKTVVGAGNSTDINSYSYFDLTSTGKMYYRVKQTDFDGKEEYSSIFTSDCSGAYTTELLAYGSKESGQLNIVINAPYTSDYSMSITNDIGQLVWRKELSLLEGVNNFYYPINNQASGIYFINLYNQSESITRKILW